VGDAPSDVGKAETRTQMSAWLEVGFGGGVIHRKGTRVVFWGTTEDGKNTAL